ncbi:MAG: hypothetical protein JWQ38_2477 [Flavipsychrobacter sp.]|nr:hypothetical protein [Flavipsychrobacter sp.]
MWHDFRIYYNMKKLILIAAVACGSLYTTSLNAQISVNINIGSQPVWGPVGYDHVEYYYIPDIDAYYYVPRHEYIYMDNNRWVTVTSLPPRYRTIDLYTVHKVVINEPSPWLHHERYHNQYIQYKGKHDQRVIRDSHEEKYWQNPGHPEHGKWKGNNGNHNGNNNPGHGNGNPHQNRPPAGPGNGNPHQNRPPMEHGNGNDHGHGNEGHGDQGHGNEGHGNGGHDKGGHGHGH